jgi:hypothetical protein
MEDAVDLTSEDCNLRPGHQLMPGAYRSENLSRVQPTGFTEEKIVGTMCRKSAGINNGEKNTYSKTCALWQGC